MSSTDPTTTPASAPGTATRVSFNAARQLEIYRRAQPLSPDDIPFDYYQLRALAIERTEHNAFTFVDGGAGTGRTVEANRAAFDRWHIMPRMLRPIATRSTAIDLFNRTIPSPILIAPIGVQAGMHPEGEIATGRAAASLGLPFVISTVASHAMEAVAAGMGDAPRWFQLYWPSDEALTQSFLQRAEAINADAIVLTLDTPTLGWRPRDLSNGFLPFLHGKGLGNYTSDPVFRAALPVPPEQDMQPAIERYLAVFSDLSRTWEDVATLRRWTNRPILLKGIQHPDDATRCLDAGADGIIVSNHGGRQVDGAVGSLEVLPAIVEAVADRVPVLFDSGIRTGSDVYKALALGATAVLVGRPYMYGLAAAGERGVREVLANLMAEFDLTMALAGRSCVDQITSDDLLAV